MPNPLKNWVLKKYKNSDTSKSFVIEEEPKWIESKQLYKSVLSIKFSKKEGVPDLRNKYTSWGDSYYTCIDQYLICDPNLIPKAIKGKYQDLNDVEVPMFIQVFLQLEEDTLLIFRKLLKS